MKQIARRSLWLPLLVLALGWTAWPALSGEPPPERRLTTDTDLVGLAWGPEGLRVARVGSRGEAEWVRLAPEAPSQLAPAAAPPTQLPPGVELRQDGPHSELYLEGRLILATDFEAVGRPALAPDGQWLVVSRGPMGAGTAALAELWRYDVAAGSWTRLTYNNLEESSPAVSPDGSEIAFLRDGSLWLRPATADAPRAVSAPAPPGDALPAGEGPVSPQAQEAPPTIRVVHVEENTCRPGVEVAEVVTIPLEAYLPGVLRTETIMSWTDEALKANSVAERSYAWSLILSPKYPADAGYDIKDWTHDQAYCECWWTGGVQRCGTDDPYYSRAAQIVSATAGQYIAHDGPPSYYSPVVRAFYGADNSSPTTAIPGNPVFQAVDDPPSFASKLSGHGWGMGQWNSQRWALEGWSYVQILRHFYSNTTVEHPAGTDRPPLFDFDRPWHGRYLTGSGLYLTANATGAGRPVTAVEFRAGWPGGGWRVTDTVGSDGWSALLDLRPLPELSAEGVGTALRVAGTAFDAAGRTSLEQGPDAVGILAGIDRLRPALTATLASTTGLTATLNITAADAGPSGIGGVGWSRGWLWEESRLASTIGTAIEDPAAIDGRAMEARAGRDEPGIFVSGPAFEELPPTDLYRAWFRLRTGRVANPDEVAILEVVDSGGSRLLGVKRLRGADFRAADQYQEFFVDFDYREYAGHPAPSGGLEFRVRWLGGANLAFDRVLVTTWPRPVGSSLDVPMTLGETVVLKATDVAGNASDDVFVSRPAASEARYLPVIVKE